MDSEESRRLARINSFEGIIDSLKSLQTNSIADQKRVSKLLVDAEASLVQEKLDWNAFILKYRT